MPGRVATVPAHNHSQTGVLIAAPSVTTAMTVQLLQSPLQLQVRSVVQLLAHAAVEEFHSPYATAAAPTASAAASTTAAAAATASATAATTAAAGFSASLRALSAPPPASLYPPQTPSTPRPTCHLLRHHLTAAI